MNLPITDMPNSIKKEVDKLNEALSPFIKKYRSIRSGHFR